MCYRVRIISAICFSRNFKCDIASSAGFMSLAPQTAFIIIQNPTPTRKGSILKYSCALTIHTVLSLMMLKGYFISITSRKSEHGGGVTFWYSVCARCSRKGWLSRKQENRVLNERYCTHCLLKVQNWCFYDLGSVLSTVVSQEKRSSFKNL